MDYKISKELFEAVMGIETDRLFCTGSFIKNDSNYLSTSIIEENKISINDFFFKCKEWVLEQRYGLTSYMVKKDSGRATVWKHELGKSKRFISTTEQQAVFDACQWILNNKDQQ